MKRKSVLYLFACFAGAATAWAHFQVLLPSSDLAGQKNRAITFDIRFTHPMAGGPVMAMAPPVQFGVVLDGEKKDLKSTLKERDLKKMGAYTARYTVKAPGDHLFFLEPAPYWEPAEGKWIIHYTKVIVNAFGYQDGWDKPVGLPVEILPLTRPYGLWTGNLFRGVALHNGKPVPFATIEVEYWNPRGDIKIPDDTFITQVIKTDANGVFAYAMPRAGWWAFAALIDGQGRPAPDGSPAEVELGGLIWIHCVDMQSRRELTGGEKGNTDTGSRQDEAGKKDNADRTMRGGR